MKKLVIVCGPTGSGKEFAFGHSLSYLNFSHLEVAFDNDNIIVETSLESNSDQVHKLISTGIAKGYLVNIVNIQLIRNFTDLFGKKKSIFEKIIENAVTFKVPLAEVPTNHGIERLAQFHEVLTDEVDELLDDVSIVNVADTLADIIVYCLNEGARWGIPMESVLHLVIDSQRSKLLPNGEPLWAEDGSKYLKGPNFEAPEPKIARLLADVAMKDQVQGIGGE